MLETKVINIKDAPPGWRRNPQYVMIGRPGPWGNPYSHLERSAAQFKVATREEAVASFEKDFLSDLEMQIRAARELMGKTLVCYCDPLPCHGHPIAKHLNQIARLLEETGCGR